MGLCNRCDQQVIAGSAGPRGPASLAQPWPLRAGLELKQSLRRHFLGKQGGERVQGSPH